MAILGGIILIFISVTLLWVALMGTFNIIGDMIINRFERTFTNKKEGKGNE